MLTFEIIILKTSLYFFILIQFSSCSVRDEKISNEAEESVTHPIGERKSGLVMIFIEGGEYMMGGSDSVDDGGKPELRIADECPHPITINDFSIGKYEVTQKDWIEVIGHNPSYNRDCDDCPVEQVSWNDTQAFIEKLNLKSGENYRLPTEEEWEFAAKGGLKSEDFIYAGSNEVEKVAWFRENSDGKSQSVGKLAPNELGI